VVRSSLARSRRGWTSIAAGSFPPVRAAFVALLVGLVLHAMAGRLWAQKRPPDASFWSPIAVTWIQAFEAVPVGPPAFDATSAYVALSDNRLVAVALRTGAVTWTLAQALTSPPALSAGTVLVADGSTLLAVDAAAGTIRWTQDLGAPCVLAPRPGVPGIAVLTDKPELLLLRPDDGSVAWRLPLKARARTPAEGDAARVYIGLTDGTILGVDARTGQVAWTRALGSQALCLTLERDRLFIGTSDNLACSLDTDSGKVRFRWRTGGDVNGAIASDDKRVYLASMDNSITALGRGGDMKWQQRLPSRPVGGPAVYGNVVMLTSVAADLRIFYADNGTLGDTVELPGRPIERPHVVTLQGVRPPLAVMLTAGGQLFAVSPQAEPPVVPFDPTLGVLPSVDLLDDVEPPLVPMLYPPGRLLPPETLPVVRVIKSPAA